MMHQSPLLAVLLPLSAVWPSLVHAESFLGAHHAGQTVVNMQVRSESLQEALGAVLGCTGGGDSHQGQARTEAIRAGLQPMWRALPKNRHGRVEWRLLRYVTHRHFMQSFNVLVRGLEPTIQVNESHAGGAEILSLQAPALATQLTGPEKEHGFSLEDAVVMVAALEHLLFDSDRSLLEKIYGDRRHATNGKLDREQLQTVLKDYMVYWMIGDDPETARLLLGNLQLLEASIPHWAAISGMVAGSVKALEFSRQRAQEPGAGHTALDGRFSFEDALEVAGIISKSFGAFWETQCQDTKAFLVALDAAGTGRVRLPDFYGANKGGEWRFGESEAYLKELGALDETSLWRGTQVIVSNYMQAASNCVVTRPHYLVCCMVECEEILGQIEADVGAPLATAEQVLQIVENMTDGDDEPARLDPALRAQLERVAQIHGGRVPLHGRLFAQWLHYVFPRECAFPHKAGNAASRTPAQFGDDSIVSPEEVSKRVADDVVQQDLAGGNATLEQEQWMSQWSEDEELLGDYSQHVASWDHKHAWALGLAAAGLSLLVWAGAGEAHAGEPKRHSV